MNLERAFRLSSIALVAVGFSGLLVTGELPVGLAALGLAALIVSVAHVSKGGSQWLIFRLPQAVWNVLIVGAFLAFAIDLFWISQDILRANVHFLIVLMVNKLFTLERRKDFLHLYVISLLELLASAALTVELWYAAVFMAYLLAAIWTLILYHLKVEAEEEPAPELPVAGRQIGTGPEGFPGLVTARFFWTTNAIAVGALCLTLTIFFVTPRVGAGFLQNSRLELIRTIGFAEKVDLGVIGAVKLDPTVVMRVEFPDQKVPASDRLYFRGAAYDVYDGRSWANTFTRRRVLERTLVGTFNVPTFNGSPRAPKPPAIRQEILIEALDTPALFGASFVDSIKGSFLVLQVDGMGAVSLPDRPSMRFQYSAFSVPGRLLAEERTAAALAYPAEIVDNFLQLPSSIPRVAALARTVTRDARTPYEAAAAIERYLRDNYRYSLDVGMARTASPVEDFLFTRRTGYCEHYATAMVLMLRALGIPVRLVTGFLPGEWNDFGNYYTVRQRDAHAWVEVFFPKSGWITFDPTPSVATTPNPLWAMAGRLVDSIRLKWYRYVIQYSLLDQISVVQAIHQRTTKVRSEVLDFLSAVTRLGRAARMVLIEFARAHRPSGHLLWGIAGVVALAGLLGVAAVRWRLWAGPRVTGSTTARQATAIRMYGRMLRLLEARGLRKAPGATPLEFARLVSREWQDAGRFVEPLTELYCRVRFGQAPLLPKDLQWANDLLSDLGTVRR